MTNLISAYQMNTETLTARFSEHGLCCTADQHDGLVVHLSGETGCGGVSASTQGTRWQPASTGDQLGAVVVWPSAEHKTLLFFGFATIDPALSREAGNDVACRLKRHSILARYHRVTASEHLVATYGLPYQHGVFEMQMLDAVHRFARDIPAAVRAAEAFPADAPGTDIGLRAHRTCVIPDLFANSTMQGDNPMESMPVAATTDVIAPEKVDAALVERVLRESFARVENPQENVFVVFQSSCPITVLFEPEKQMLLLAGKIGYRDGRRQRCLRKAKVRCALLANEIPSHVGFSVDDEGEALHFDHAMSYAWGLSASYLEFLIRHTATLGPMVALQCDEYHLLNLSVA